ncbi:MAG: nucleotide exchange factor GrpE [Granulosicoccaceae bacterium]
MPDEPRENEQNDAEKVQQPQTEQAAEPTNATSEQTTEAAEQGAEPVEQAAVEGEVVLDPLTELKEALEAERARADENYDLALRTKAEMENLRKRSSTEVDKAKKFALEKFATEIIAVRDSLEMGLDAASKDDADVTSIREGTDLTLKMLVSAMDKFQVEQVDPTGQPFDPELHQAMGMQESADHAPNTVMMVMQKGYTLNGRLIRPAMVMVSKA